MSYTKGDLYFVRYFEDNGKKGRGRPAVIVSGEEVNLTRDTVMVAYLTSNPSRDISRTRVDVTSTGRDSTAILERVTTIPKYRLGDYMGHISLEESSAIDSALCVAFDL